MKIINNRTGHVFKFIKEDWYYNMVDGAAPIYIFESNCFQCGDEYYVSIGEKALSDIKLGLSKSNRFEIKTCEKHRGRVKRERSMLKPGQVELTCTE